MLVIRGDTTADRFGAVAPAVTVTTPSTPSTLLRLFFTVVLSALTATCAVLTVWFNWVITAASVGLVKCSCKSWIA